MNRKPDFDNVRRILAREVPRRDTLFEFFLNAPLYKELTKGEDIADPWLLSIAGFRNAGYDYATLCPVANLFARPARTREASFSLNEAPVFSDRAGFDRYAWRKTEDELDMDLVERAARFLAPGMKLILHGPGGLLENTISLFGFDNLCFALADDPAFVVLLTDTIGARLLRYYELVASHPAAGACIVNDDWGFNSQPMISPEAMRKYIIPWHAKMVAAIHRAGKPAILHSCGNLASLLPDIIDVCKYDAKHSYEDKIMPVEDAYEAMCGKIAVLGGIDLDYLCRRSPEEIRARSAAMLRRAAGRGGYALGSGNSIPEYVPWENYFAMTSAVLEN